MSLFILCLQIFFARILDVTLGTCRMVLTVKGKSAFAAITSFIEVFIWFMIAREALNTEITSIWIPIAYAGGFATGTFIGSIISKKLIKGFIGIQIVTENASDEMIKAIRDHGFAVSKIKLDDENPKKKMLYIQLINKKQQELTNLIRNYDEKAFIVVNETKYLQNGFIK